jgi:hypothetical protein
MPDGYDVISGLLVALVVLAMMAGSFVSSRP